MYVYSVLHNAYSVVFMITARSTMWRRYSLQSSGILSRSVKEALEKCISPSTVIGDLLLSRGFWSRLSKNMTGTVSKLFKLTSQIKWLREKSFKKLVCVFDRRYDFGYFALKCIG